MIDRCVAYANGTLTDGTSNANGDRNGFKMGGSDIPVPHTITRCLAYGNGKNGITFNSNPGAITVVNCLCFDNAEGNFKFDDPGPVFYNNASLYTSGTGINDRYGGASGAPTGATNCFWRTGSSTRGPSINDAGITVSVSSFVTLTPPAGGFARRADGSLEYGDFARPVTAHRLINGGVTPPGITLPYDVAYYLGVPDIGLVEWRSGFQLWRAQQFSEAMLSLPHTAAGAPAADGEANVLHYLLGISALEPVPAGLLPHMEQGPAFRWYRHPSASDLTVLPLTSTTLAGWSSLPARLVTTASGLQQWEAILPEYPGARGFFTLEVSAP